MQHLLTAIKASIAQRNWYSALSLTLVLPDICGWLEDPSAGTQDRYVSWFDRFVAANYTGAPDAGSRIGEIFLGGRDCYALRCAFLHEGREEIIGQRAREVLDRFQFTVAPQPGLSIHHCNRYDSKLQLQGDIFCSEFVVGGEAWLQQVGTRPEVQERMLSLLRIYDVQGRPIA